MGKSKPGMDESELADILSMKDEVPANGLATTKNSS